MGPDGTINGHFFRAIYIGLDIEFLQIFAASRDRGTDIGRGTQVKEVGSGASQRQMREKLEEWLNEQFTERKVEPNSGLQLSSPA